MLRSKFFSKTLGRGGNKCGIPRSASPWLGARTASGGEGQVIVSVDNYVRVETSRHLADYQTQAGGLNKWSHRRNFVDIDAQDVIRMNRDTLYSGAILDIRSGGTITIPDSEGRYMSVAILNEDHYVNRVFHGSEPGTFELTLEEFHTPYVAAIARTFVNNPLDSEDVQAANDLQDGLAVTASSSVPYEQINYSEESLVATLNPLLVLAEGSCLGVKCGTQRFGSRMATSEVKHLLGCAYGWGGLPVSEAFYQQDNTFKPTGDHTMTIVGEVPVDAFWSVSVYTRDGYFDINNPWQPQYCAINSSTVVPDDVNAETKTYTIHFGKDPSGKKNFLYIMDGWTYTVRMYQPQASIIQGTWKFPDAQPVANLKTQ